jgi:O-antigen ligase
VFTAPTTQLGRRVNSVLAIGICLLLGFGPLAFGIVQPWSVCVLEVTVALLVMVWAARETANGAFCIIPNPLYLPMALFASVVLLQIVLHRSAYWYATWSAGMLWASYAGLFFLISQVFCKQPWASVFGYFCVVYGFLLSMFAIVQQFTSNGKIYWVVANRYGGWIYGPYVNHAHYAGLMEMLVPFPVIFAIVSKAGRTSRAFFLFIAVVASSTIFLSQSLGGMIAVSVELGVLSLVLFRNRRSTYREILLLGILCIALIAWLVWLRPPGLVERFARLLNPITDAGATGRVAIVKDSFRMLRERPILGWGLGTFPTVYPTFRSFYTNFWVNEAHNDFIQTLVETGIVGFAFACAFLALLCRAGIQNLRHWRNDTRSSLAFAAFLGCIGLMVHGFVDFNLQIPANAAFFFALSALVTSRSNQLDSNQEFGRERGQQE